MKEKKYYGIEVAGVEVTSYNCKNITGVGITGSVTYNPETKTLTLDNATINGSIWFGAGDSRLENITITLIGENTLTNYIGSVSGTKTINGTGSLKVECIAGFLEKNTIIEDCTIDIDAATHDWDWATYGHIGKLTIKNANLSSEALEVAIGDFADIKLIGCEIVEPTNAQIIYNEFDGQGVCKYVCDGDGNIAKKVVIKNEKRNGNDF